MKCTTTLWNLLREQKIVIPPIQRDYAQGRKGKEVLRKTFLQQIKDHLDNENELTLDFIYGNVENNAFHPLDGQQRLTTLWLLHWYLACYSGELEKVKDILKNFTYETRISSRSFCEALCDKITSIPDSNIGEFIKQQTWFFSEWIQDPTIDAMLRTLGGDGESNDQDNIESVFYKSDRKAYWERLQEKNIITFEQMIIGSEQLPIADDLYIKMNARGKKLTDFENFKADLVYNIDFFSDITKNIDSTWTDVIWNAVKEREGDRFNGEIDDEFFAFINRFTANCICLYDLTIPVSTIAPKSDVEKEDIAKHFDKISGSLYGDDTHIIYEGFDVYETYLLGKIQKLDIIFQNLKNGYATDITHEYNFFPQKGVSTTNKNRIYFHAICLFLKQDICDETKLNEWMRVVHNLTENAGIDAVDTMINCLRTVDALGKEIFERDQDVYSVLASYPIPLTISKLNRQLTEEIEKAKMMQDPEWKTKILAAEKYSFFRGSIRFLYRDPNGKVNWDDFENKFLNAKNYFSKKADDMIPISTIESFLNVFERFEEHQNDKNTEECYFFTRIGESSDRRSDWKNNILCNEHFQKQVHAFLMNDTSVQHEEIYKAFLDSTIVTEICNRHNSDKYRYHWSRDWAVHPDRDQNVSIFVTDDRLQKNRIIKGLCESKKIKLKDEESNKFFGDFLWGIKIYFDYNEKTFLWDIEWGGENCIYLIDSDGNKGKSFIWRLNDQENFISELEKLLK